MAIIQGGQSAGQFFSFGPNIAQATASANRILKYRPTPVTEKNATSTGHKQPTRLHSLSGVSVEFRGIGFRYPSQGAPLYTGLNVSIKSGQFVAFVGPSGCGKTTTISLLERFYDPVQGTILLDGQDISSIELSSYRRGLSLVAQEPRLFDGTVRENITLGLDSPEFTDDELIQACTDAEIHDFITSLPQGYSTELGVKAQTALSGGQRQRLCIARALLRKPALLLLDEATSSLDSQSEKVVQAALERLAGKRSMTIIAVAHRLATIQKADVIFVFGECDEGGRGSRIVEQGTHQELLRRRGTYWQMVRSVSLVFVCVLLMILHSVKRMHSTGDIPLLSVALLTGSAITVVCWRVYSIREVFLYNKLVSLANLNVNSTPKSSCLVAGRQSSRGSQYMMDNALSPGFIDRRHFPES